MKIIITGLGKSGSTALYFKIRNSIDKATFCLFEPNNLLEISDASKNNNNILVKNLLVKDLGYSLADCYKDYDKKIYLVRDPRDNLVSRFIYGCAFNRMYHKERSEILNLLKIFQEKETKKKNTSMIKFCKIVDLNPESFLQRLISVQNFYKQNQDYFLVKYEDFISNKIADLEKFLHLKLVKDVKVDKQYSRIKRSKGSGSWRLWFTDEDVSFFKPLLKEYMQYFGYDINDWQINLFEKIPSEHCSKYFMRVLNEKRIQSNLKAISF